MLKVQRYDTYGNLDYFRTETQKLRQIKKGPADYSAMSFRRNNLYTLTQSVIDMQNAFSFLLNYLDEGEHENTSAIHVQFI